LAKLNEDSSKGWKILPKENYVKSLSQEHGTLSVSNAVFEKTQIGDIILVLPIHSCMTADLMREYLSLEGKKIAAGKY